MAHNLISKSQLGYFYESRKKLDQAIGEILGPGVHLHDISQSQSSEKSTGSVPHAVEVKGRVVGTGNGNGVVGSNVMSNGVSGVAGGRKSEKLEDFYNNVHNENKMEKLYKDNMQLQKKIMTAQNQSQTFKHKALLWQKTKQFILNTVDQQYKLKSVRFSSSDSAILEEFFVIFEDIMAKSKGMGNNVRSFRAEGEKDHTVCRQLHEEAKIKLEEETRKVAKLALQLEVLRNQNRNLKEKEDSFKKERIAKINQLSTGIDNKFSQIEQSLNQKTEQNNLLYNKIARLELQIFELKNTSSPLLHKKQKTIATNPQTVSQPSSDLQIFKQISKSKDNQINLLKNESKLLNTELLTLRTNNDKMKKVIKMAQNLNNQFLEKLEQSIRRKNKIEVNINEEVESQYGTTGWKKGGELGEFHMTNRRFKIVKSRSADKQRYRYVYGKTTKQ